MNVSIKRLHLTCLVLAIAGCNGSSPGDGTTPPPGGEQTYPDDWTPTTPADHGPTSIDPGSVVEGKTARRMSVDQLRRTIPALFAGITWTVPVNNGQRPGFTALSRTLGEADYIQSNTNNLDPSPLFTKYMDDMAGDVCTKAIAHDHDAVNATDRLVMRETDIDANLRYLRLKLHSLYVPEGSTDSIADLRILYDDVVTGGATAEDGWYAVCVAMLTAPEFMTY
jgi:hypothetical protein